MGTNWWVRSGAMTLNISSAASALLLFACSGAPESEGTPDTRDALLESDAEPNIGSDGQLTGNTALVTCAPQELLGDLGWSNIAAQHRVGEVYRAALDYVGGEECIALRYDSMLLGVTQGMDQPSSPLTIAVSQGLDLKFGSGVPVDVRGAVRADLIEPALVRLEGASVSWLDTPSLGWLGYVDGPEEVATQYEGLRNATFYPQDQFLFVVTRTYAAQRVTNVDGAVDGLGRPEYDEYALEESGYDCAALPLGEVGTSLFYDGVFLDNVENSTAVVTRTDLPRRFCPELPGSERPLGNGTLLPPEPQTP